MTALNSECATKLSFGSTIPCCQCCCCVAAAAAALVAAVTGWLQPAMKNVQLSRKYAIVSGAARTEHACSNSSIMPHQQQCHHLVLPASGSGNTWQANHGSFKSHSICFGYCCCCRWFAQHAVTLCSRLQFGVHPAVLDSCHAFLLQVQGRHSQRRRKQLH